MKALRKLSLILALGCSATLFSGCSDFLNVSDDLAAELTLQEVFDNTNYVRRFHRYIYSGIPNPANIITADGSVKSGLDNPWASLTDELKCAQFDTKNLPVTGFHAGNASHHRWDLYKQIRQANEFLEYSHVIPKKGDIADYLDEKELATLKNEARFLRAYYHYLLFELYGPIPIMSEIASQSSNDLDYYRNSVDEVVSFIDTELNACYAELPEKEVQDDGSLNKNRAAAPTKGAALAILAKLHIYAASPLLNGGYSEAVALTDNQGKSLFPAKDNGKWNTALTALQRFMDYAQGRYDLYYTKKVATDLNFDPAESLYKLYQDCETNPEVIWYSSKNPWGSLTGDGCERRSTPRAIFSGFGCVGVLQEMIDDYFMEDGKNIRESANYNEKGIAADGIPNMFKKREPRFYRDITYAGKTWQKTTTKIFFHKGSGDDNSKGDNTYSGYMFYKGMNRDLLNQGSNLKAQYRPGIIFRMADFYLLYAEALNHVNPADTRIIEYVDKIRIRAGIPALATIKPEIIGNQKMQEEAIRKERRVELFAEGQRYFDVRRWMCAEEEGYKQGGDMHGLDMGATTIEGFIANRVRFETRSFQKEMYLYPIPLAEIQKSKKLVQNPGWK